MWSSSKRLEVFVEISNREQMKQTQASTHKKERKWDDNASGTERWMLVLQFPRSYQEQLPYHAPRNHFEAFLRSRPRSCPPPATRNRFVVGFCEEIQERKDKEECH